MKTLVAAVSGFLWALGSWPVQAQQTNNLIEVGWATGGFAEAVDVVGNHAYVAARKALNVFDVSSPTSPDLITSIRMYALLNEPDARGVAVDAGSSTLYLAVGDAGLWIYSLDDPALPIRERVLGVGNVTGCSLSDGRLLVTLSDRLLAYSLADPRNPTWAGQFVEAGFIPHAAQQVGNTIYVMGIRIELDLFYPQLKVLDASSTIFSVAAFAEYPWQGGVGDVLVNGSNVYLADGTGTVYVSSFSAPSTLIDITSFLSPAGSLAKVGSMLYAGGYGQFESFDVSDLNDVVSVGTFSPPEWIGRMLVSDVTAYLPIGKAGLQILDLAAGSPVELKGHSWYPSTPYDLAYRDGHLFVADEQLMSLDWFAARKPVPVAGRHDGNLAWKNSLSMSSVGIAYLVSAGVVAIDTSDPSQLTTLGLLQLDGQEFDVSHWNRTVYSAQLSSGFAVSDFSDPTNPQLLSTFTAHRVSSLVAWENHLYVAGLDGMSVLKAFDVSDPTSPVEVWTQPNPAGSDELRIARGHLFVVGSNGTAYYDLTDPASPSLVATIPAQEWTHAIDVAGHHLYLGDGTFVRGYSIADLGNPVEVAYHEMPGTVESILHMDSVVAVGVRDSGVHFLYQIDRTSAPPAGDGSLAVYAWPNPLPGQGHLAFELGWADEVQLELFDVSGRLVRHWQRSVGAGAPTVIRWDGRDHGGRPVANGVYFYRIETSRASGSGRVTLLR